MKSSRKFVVAGYDLMILYRDIYYGNYEVILYLSYCEWGIDRNNLLCTYRVDDCIVSSIKLRKNCR